MKTYVITLSRVFPVTHKRAGQPTKFRAAFQNGQACSACQRRRPAMCAGECFSDVKKHTIRANYALWEKRIKEVQDGVACLSVREWTGKPYASPQVEIRRLTAQDGVGIQAIKPIDLFRPVMINGNMVELPVLAQNDGLTFNDWYEWFRGYDLRKNLAIIHFTPFRY